MSNAHEILRAIDAAMASKDFDSHDSIVRVNKQGGYVFEWTTNDITVKGDLVEADTIGLLLNSLEVSKNIAGNREIPTYLKESAEAIQRRINYLMEPLKVIEVDSTTNAVQIRSEKPEIQDGWLSYFEFVLKAGKWFGYRNHVALHRYSQRVDEEPGRKPVAFPLTKKQFQKLVDDLIDIL